MDANVDFRPFLYVATFAKALGCYGAFVAGKAEHIDYLIQKSRTLIYTTALPPAICAAAKQALSIVEQEPERREHLQDLIQYFRQCVKQLNINITVSDTPIQAVIVGENSNALELSHYLKQNGIYAAAIRPPTVANNSARIRISLSAAHKKQHIDKLVGSLKGYFTTHPQQNA